MTSSGGWGGYGSDSGEREPGTRRRKLAGYLKAANELRQTYQQNVQDSWASRDGSQDMPGSFPDANVATGTGKQEMLIFPSYARRHVKHKPHSVPGTIQQQPGGGRDVRDSAGAGDAEFWQQQWDHYEDDNAIVDVDVRGWVFTPHTGPMNRRNRLFIGLARQLVGLPAPASGSASSSRASSPQGLRQKMDVHNSKQEEELVAKEAETLLRKGEAEAAAAGKGAYSEKPSDDPDKHEDLEKDHRRSRDPSPVVYDDPRITPLQKRESWNAPANMSAEELQTANNYLMTRLKPFLAIPAATMPISAFFYNKDASRQKTIDTDAYGHFTLRASLDFVPTHVRVLAAEGLSATEEVIITEAHGVSIISDVDDTIKHSAIGSGAREIFRNVFIRDLGDLTIQGVADLYQKLAEQDVRFHYVSNSPYQLYPVLSGFFAQAGLPAGSFHLKQYSGMFQGIFEPVAERKKGTLEKLLRDFPERRFILMGDSGEADLEVYTDLVCENPGRILGVFIRDVTTPPERKGFFNSSMSTSSKRSQGNAKTIINGTQRTNGSSLDDDPDLKAGIAASLESYKISNGDHVESPIEEPTARPSLPARRQTEPPPQEEDLIDLTSDTEQPTPLPERKQPVRPPKPRRLSSNPSMDTLGSQETPDTAKRKLAPPIPPKKPSIAPTDQKPPLTATPMDKSKPDQGSAVKRKPPAPPQRSSYRASAKDRLNAAYEHLPSIRSVPPEPRPAPSRVAELSQSKQPIPPHEPSESHARPPLPARKPTAGSSYASTAKAYASSLYNSAAGTSSTDSLPLPQSGQTSNSVDPAYNNASMNKKTELWKRRWQRAQMILADDNVVLKSWRVGGDVLDDAIALVEMAKRQDERKARGMRSRSTGV